MTTSNDEIRDRVAVVHDVPGQRYALDLDGSVIGFTEYRDHDGRRVFFHTEIDDAYAGHGLSSILVKNALDDVRAHRLRVVAVCPLVAKYVGKHTEVQDIVDPVTPQVLDYLDNALK
jgi:uncharacterized protein